MEITDSSSETKTCEMTGNDILQNAKKLAPILRENRSRFEKERCIPTDIHSMMLEAGLYRMTMPHIWGGPELTSMQQVEIIEEISKADGAAGWCTMIGCDSGLYSAYLDDEVARKLYPKLDMVTAGWVSPVGKIQKVDNGYILNGRWAFGSGCKNANIITGGCLLVDDNNENILKENGEPVRLAFLMPQSEFEILDTWYCSGLSGTGSHDYEAKNLFVPEEQVFDFFAPCKRQGTLYARYEALLRKMPGVPLGIAKNSLEYSIEFLQHAPHRKTSSAKVAIAKAETLINSSRAYLFLSLENLWKRLDAKEQLTKQERVDVSLARNCVFQSCRDAARILYDELGVSSIYTNRSPLDQNLRDLNAACQHIVAQTKTLEFAGNYMIYDEPWAFI